MTAEPFAVQEVFRDLLHFGRGVRLHGKHRCEPAHQSRVDVHEIALDFILVPSDDADEPVPVLRQHAVESIDRRFAERIPVTARSAIREGRRFVQEEDASES